MNDPRSDSFHPLDDPQITRLYRETRDAEPPDWLDQRILLAAQAALEEQQQPAAAIPLPKPRPRRMWRLPLTLAATVMLAVGLIRLLPPVDLMSGMPTVLQEEKAAQVRSSAAADKVTPLAESAKSRGKQRNQPSAPAAAAPGAPVMESRQQQLSPTLSVQGDQPLAGDEQATTEADNQAKWLAEIAELRRQGRHAEAEASLAAFRRHYPNAAAEPLR